MTVNTMTALLKHFGWTPVGLRDHAYEVWVFDDEEIVLPLATERGDFAGLMRRAQSALEHRYGRFAVEAIESLQVRESAALDATKWHQETPVQGGLIGWQQGETLYRSARAQLMAAARSALESRRYHGNSGSHLARAFLDRTLMGQTEPGSFVITAFTPGGTRFYASKTAEDQASVRGEDLYGVQSVTGADVLDTFKAALAATREVLDTYRTKPRIEQFREVVGDGVSYELLLALSEVAATGQVGIDVDALPLGGADRVPRYAVSFEPPDSTVLRSAATSFAQDPEPQSVAVTGEVTLLSRTVEEDQFARLIRLQVFTGAGIRRVRVRLSEEDYELAQGAHHDEVMLRVSGILTREANFWWITNPTSVELVEPVEQVIEPGAPEDTTITIDEFLEESD
ncbi:MAG: hypothetical protein WCD35_16650 [Mycobacteriales bacterium]